MTAVAFSTTMLLNGNNTGIEVPAEQVEALGGGKRAAVLVRVNGYEYRSTLAVMGGKHLIPFSSDKRAATGIAGGDPIDVELELDTAPRTVEVPIDLAEALAAAGLPERVAALAPSRQKAHGVSVGGAKAAETRQRRVEAVIAKVGGA